MTGIFLSGMLGGMENLTSYLKSKGLSQKQFAESVGITQSSLSKMCAGLIMPSLDTAIRIAKETSGAVPADCWAGAKANEASVK